MSTTGSARTRCDKVFDVRNCYAFKKFRIIYFQEPHFSPRRKDGDAEAQATLHPVLISHIYPVNAESDPG